MACPKIRPGSGFFLSVFQPVRPFTPALLRQGVIDTNPLFHMTFRLTMERQYGTNTAINRSKLGKTSPMNAPNTHPERAPNTRSRTSNGSQLLPGVDGRSAWVRRARDLIELHTHDLGGDLSAAEASIVRRAAVLSVELERMEARFAADPASPEALDLYGRQAGNLRRLLESLGLERRARDLVPDPLVYAQSRAA